MVAYSYYANAFFTIVWQIFCICGTYSIDNVTYLRKLLELTDNFSFYFINIGSVV